MQSVINNLKGTALGVAELFTPVLKVYLITSFCHCVFIMCSLFRSLTSFIGFQCFVFRNTIFGKPPTFIGNADIACCVLPAPPEVAFLPLVRCYLFTYCKNYDPLFNSQEINLHLRGKIPYKELKFFITKSGSSLSCLLLSEYQFHW